MNAIEAIKSYSEQDLLRQQLESSLFHSFLHAGYEPEECAKLVSIAIGPVSSALDLAHAAYKLHIDAINVQPRNYFYPK